MLEEGWLKPHALIVCSGSDQPTKNEIPPNVLKKAMVVTGTYWGFHQIQPTVLPLTLVTVRTDYYDYSDRLR